jgi:hypothetical protein
MAGFKGEALFYPLLLLSSWVAVRTAVLSWESAPEAMATQKGEPAQPMAAPQVASLTTAQANPRAASHRQTTQQRPRSKHGSAKICCPPSSPPRMRTPAMAELSYSVEPSAKSERQIVHDREPVAQRQRAAAPNRRDSRWFGYAYSFWRTSGSQGAIAAAPGGEYGGSQSGFILGHDLGGEPNRGLALLARAAASPRRGGEEVAVGLRWQRPAALPISLTAERRIVTNGRDRWATYAAGGIDTIALPAA